MPWNDPQWWADNWGAVAVVLAVLGAAYAAAKRIWPKLRRFGHLVDDLAGEPERPGVDARPGVMERLRELDRVTAELRPNGGASMKDVLHRLDRRTERLDQRLAAVERLTIPNREEQPPMALSGQVVRDALAAAGAVGKQLRPFDELAAGASAALRQAPPGLTPDGAAAFLATCCVESAWFRTTVEYGSGQRYAPFIGRTFIQLTWQDNYRGFGRWCRARGLVDRDDVFVRDPSRLGAYEFAWLGAVYYFETADLWGWANAGDFRRVSQAVNGGRSRAGTAFVPNGWGDRQAIYAVFLRAGNALLPAPSEEDDMTPDQARKLDEVHAKLHGWHPTRVHYEFIGEPRPPTPPGDDIGGYAINADARSYETRQLLVAEVLPKLDALLAARAQPVEAVLDTVDGGPLLTADQVRQILREALADAGPLYLTTKETPS